MSKSTKKWSDCTPDDDFPGRPPPSGTVAGAAQPVSAPAPSAAAHGDAVCGGPPTRTFSLLSATSNLRSLSTWWNDSKFGPLADGQGHSWLLAFPKLRSVTFAPDGLVTIAQYDSSHESARQAERAEAHIQKVTRKMQRLRCRTCGNVVASTDKACCKRNGKSRTASSLCNSFRVASAVVETLFGSGHRCWEGASEEAGKEWVESHVHSTGSSAKYMGGHVVEAAKPVLFQRSDRAREVERQVLTMLNSMECATARLTIIEGFTRHPYCLIASSFRTSSLSEFLERVHLDKVSRTSMKEPDANEQFGEIIDQQLRLAVKSEKFSGDDKGWSPARSSFGVLPHPRLENVFVCQETDALYGNHIVEFKTLESVEGAAKRSQKLGQYLRQMAVSQTILRETHPGGFIVMMGRSDRRVLVLEDVGAKDCSTGLPLAFSWITPQLDKWFSADNPYERFLDSFVKVVAQYSQQCARRKELWDRDKKQNKETGKPFTDLSRWKCFLDLILPNHERLLAMKPQAADDVPTAPIRDVFPVPRAICGHFASANGCKKGDLCEYSHAGAPTGDGAAPQHPPSLQQGRGKLPAIQHHDDGVCGIGVDLVKDGELSGVFITAVYKGRGAEAARAGGLQLQRGDRIVQAGPVVVTTLAEATGALVGLRNSEVELLIQRNQKKGKGNILRFYITVTRC